MTGGLLSVRLGVAVLENTHMSPRQKEALELKSGLESAIKASQQLEHFARQFRDNDGSALITSFKQQAKSMGDHTVNLAPVRLHKYEPDPEGVRRVAEMYVHRDASVTEESLLKPLQVNQSVLDGTLTLDIKTSDKSKHLKETQVNPRVKMAFSTCLSEMLGKHCSDPQVSLTSVENAENGKGVKIGYRCNLFHDGSEEDAKRTAHDVARMLQKKFSTRKDVDRRKFVKMMRLRTGILPADDPKSTFGFRDVGDVKVEKSQNLALVPTIEESRDANDMSANRASMQKRRRPAKKKFSFKPTQTADSPSRSKASPKAPSNPHSGKVPTAAPLKLTRAKTNARIVLSGLASHHFIENADLAFALTATIKNHVLRCLGRGDEALPPPEEESKEDEPRASPVTRPDQPIVTVEVRPHRPGEEGRPDIKFQLAIQEPRAPANKAQARKWKQQLLEQASKGKHNLVTTFRRRRLRTAFFREFRLFARAALLRMGFGRLVESIGEIAPAKPKPSESKPSESKVSVDEMRAGVSTTRRRKDVDSKENDSEESELDENYDMDDWIDDGGGMFSGPIKVETSTVRRVIHKAGPSNNGVEQVVYENDFEPDEDDQPLSEWSSDFDEDDEDDLKNFLQKQVKAGVTGAAEANAELAASSKVAKPHDKQISGNKLLSVIGSIPLSMQSSSAREAKDSDEDMSIAKDAGRAALEKALKELVAQRSRSSPPRRVKNGDDGRDYSPGAPADSLGSLFDVQVNAFDEEDGAAGGFTTASFVINATTQKTGKRRGKRKRKGGVVTRALKRDAEQMRRRIEAVLQNKQERAKFAQRVAYFASHPSGSKGAADSSAVGAKVTIGTESMTTVMMENVATKKKKKTVNLKDAVGENDLSQVDVRGTIALKGIKATSITNGAALREALQKAIGNAAHSCIGSSSATAAASPDDKVAILKAQTQLQKPKVRWYQS